MSEDRPVDPFDRVIGTIDGLPDVRKAKPTTVTTVLPILGRAQTYVIQTYQTEDGFVGFVQYVDANGGARFVLPSKVMSAIYRQREALIKSGRKQRGRDRWDNLDPDQKEAAVTRLRSGRKAQS